MHKNGTKRSYGNNSDASPVEKQPLVLKGTVEHQLHQLKKANESQGDYISFLLREKERLERRARAAEAVQPGDISALKEQVAKQKKEKKRLIGRIVILSTQILNGGKKQ